MHRRILRFPVLTKSLEVHPHCLGELRHRQVRVAIEGGPHFIWDTIKNIPSGRHGVGMHISSPPGVVGLGSGTYRSTMDDRHQSLTSRRCPIHTSKALTRRTEKSRQCEVSTTQIRAGCKKPAEPAGLIVVKRMRRVVTPPSRCSLHKKNRRENDQARYAPNDTHHQYKVHSETTFTKESPRRRPPRPNPT
jgi:hypothetical protein